MARKIPPALIAVAVLVVIVPGIIVLTLMSGQETAKPVLSGTGHANPAAPAATLTSRIANAPKETAAPQPEEGSPGSDAASARSSLVEHSPTINAHACIMVPVEDGFMYENNTGFNAGSAENYSVPVSMKNPGMDFFPV